MAESYQSQVKIQQLFRDLTPFRVARDLGLRPQQEARGCWLQHPSRADSRIWLTDTEFVCLDIVDDFRCGDVFDFLAWRLGGEQQAVRHVIQHYTHLASEPAMLQQTAGFLASDLKQRRDVRRQWDQQFARFAWDTQKYAEVRMLLRRLQAHPRLTAGLLFGATGEDLSRLPGLEHVTLDPVAQFLVLPAYSRFSQIAAVELVPVRHPDDVSRVWMEDVSHAFFGALSAPPQQPRVHCYTDWRDVLLQISCGACLNLGTVQVWLNSARHAAGMRLPAAIGMHGEGDDTALLAMARNAFDEFYIASRHTGLMDARMPVVTTWTDFVIQRIEYWIKTGQERSPEMQDFLLHLSHDSATVDKLIAHLERNGTPMPVMRRVQEGVSRMSELVLGAMRVLETPDGYVGRREGRAESLFTNFTITVEKNVWFSDTVFAHYGQVRINRQAFPFQILNKDANEPQEVLNQAILAVRRHGQTTELPVVTDTTMRARLPTVISVQASKCGRNVTGIMTLGWTQHRTRFVTPTWIAEATQIKPTEKLLYPFSDMLSRHYAARAFNWRHTWRCDRPETNTLLAIVLALMERSFLALPSPLVMTQSDQPTRQALEAVFNAFGQMQPVHVGNNQRSRGPRLDSMHLDGLPVLVTSDTPEALNLRDPVLVQSSTGFSVGEPLRQHEYAELSSAARHLTSRLAMGLIQEGRPVHIEEPEQTTVERLIQRGRDLAVQVGAPGEFVVRTMSPVPAFNALLYKVPSDRLPMMVEFNLSNQTVVMKVDRRQAVAEILRDELQRLDATARMLDKDRVEFSLGVFNSLVEIFYGKVNMPAKPVALTPMIG